MARILDGSFEQHTCRYIRADAEGHVSTLHIHPDAITYLCDDTRSYEAVEDSTCGIRGNLERLAEPIDRDDCFGFVDNELHYIAGDRSTPRVIPPVQLHTIKSARAIPHP